MGLKNYKQYRFEQKIKESETISKLQNKINELEAQVKTLLESQAKPTPTSSYDNLTEKEKKFIKEAAERSIKPEDVIKQFAGNLQEFDPYA